MVDDFKLATGADSLHGLNAPSSAATASLALAELIADDADLAVDLGGSHATWRLTSISADQIIARPSGQTATVVGKGQTATVVSKE
jgi:hypothetical protein